MTAHLTVATSGRELDGFAAVFREHREAAVRLAYMLCGDPHVAEDVVADAFARTLPRFERGQVENVGAYIRQAVVNEVRSRQRRMPLVRRERLRRIGDFRGERGTAEEVADRHHARWLLEQVSTRQRTALVLRFWADLSDAEAARTMGCPVGTYRSLVSRGLARLRIRHDDEAEGRR